MATGPRIELGCSKTKISVKRQSPEKRGRERPGKMKVGGEILFRRLGDLRR